MGTITKKTISILNDAKNRLEKAVGKLTSSRTRAERTIKLLELQDKKLTEISSTLTPCLERLNLVENNLALLYQALRERIAELGEA
ncbi:hypothetical protein FACS189428_5380 [Clostridia bacterium]|nr:hypothetical protein FACS189428_5380 [Clostridia bacterium]